MPDSTQNLVFKLIIDGKEAVATLDVVTGKFTLTGEAAEQMNSEMVKAYTELIGEALKYDVVNEANIKTLQEFIAAKGMTIEQIENSIQALDAETAKLGINTVEWNKGMAVSANLKAALGGVIQHALNDINDVQIGYSTGDAIADPFLFTFAQIAIYKRKLTAEQISYLYNGGDGRLIEP